MHVPLGPESPSRQKTGTCSGIPLVAVKVKEADGAKIVLGGVVRTVFQVGAATLDLGS